MIGATFIISMDYIYGSVIKINSLVIIMSLVCLEEWHHIDYDSVLEEYLALLEKLHQNLAASLLMFFLITHSSARCSCRKR